MSDDNDIEDAEDWLSRDPEELSREDLIKMIKALDDEFIRQIDKRNDTLRDRGLTFIDNGIGLIIDNREKAVAWFEQELADFEEA